MFDAFQLEGEQRDIAIAGLAASFNQKLEELRDWTTNATATDIKTNILDVYFKERPADYDAGKEIQDNIDALQEERENGNIDAGVIIDYIANLTDTEKAALDSYNTYITSSSVNASLDRYGIQNDAAFQALNIKADSIVSNVTNYIRDNVLNVIGRPEVTEEEATALNPQRDASGLYALVQEGDQDILDVLGELGTIEDGVLTGGKGILKDMQLLGMDNDEIKSFLDTNLGSPAQPATDTTPAKDATGIYGLVDANTEQYNSLVGDYNTLTSSFESLTGDFQALADSTANKISNIDATIGTLPTLVEGTTDQYEGGSGLRLELFNQGLSIEEINATFGSEDDSNSILGRLAAIKNTADGAATASDLATLDDEVGDLTTTIGDAESGLVKTVNDLSDGVITKNNFGQALIDQGVLTTTNIGQALIDADVATGTDVTEAIEGIQFPEPDLSGLATTEQVTQAIEGIQFPETDLSGLATKEQAGQIQATVDQVADFMGKPSNLVTDADIEAFNTVLATFEAEQAVAEADMLRYDVSGVDGTPDGKIDIYDQQVLQAGLEGDYTGFAPDAQFNQATGMFLQQEQDAARIAQYEADLLQAEQDRILAEQQFDQEQAQREVQLRQDIATDTQLRQAAQEKQEADDAFMAAIRAPGRTMVNQRTGDTTQIEYFYDMSREGMFANPTQEEFYGAASPFGTNFLDEIILPQQRAAKGGIIEDDTDKILKIIGDD